MTAHSRALAAYLLALTLAACGGGGSGGGAVGSAPAGNASSSAGNWLTFNPAALSATQYEGEDAQILVTASSSRTFTTPFNVAVIDPGGLIATKISASAAAPMTYESQLNTNPGLSAGTHSTTLEVRVCEDDPLACSKPFPGSPWRLPLTVNVKSKAEAASRLALSVPSVSVTTYPGEAAHVIFDVQLNPELTSKRPHVGVVDPARLVAEVQNQYLTSDNGHFAFDLPSSTSTVLAPGTYTTNLQVRACMDEVSICRQPVTGSPWTLPLTVIVKSPTNLSVLKPIDGLGAWSTYQGNAAHTGFVDASFDPAVFSRRWMIPSAANYSDEYASTAVDGGRVFFSRHARVQPDSSVSQLVAVSEDTGQIAWTVDMEPDGRANPPAVANARVYITSTGPKDSHLRIYDQATGKLINRALISTNYSTWSAPTVVGNDVYTVDGYYNGIAKYSDQNGDFSWNSRIQGLAGGWSPASDGQSVYTFTTYDFTLTALDARDGSRVFSLTDPGYGGSAALGNPVMLTDTHQAIVATRTLKVYDLTANKLAWTSDKPVINAAYGNGTVYSIGPERRLEARSPATGALLWTSEELACGGWNLNNCHRNIIVTRNLAFVSSSLMTLAIDLNTHKTVWTYPQGGSLAISPRGVLYMLTELGDLAAVNLR